MFALRGLVITPIVLSAAFVSGGSSLSAAATVVEDVADNTIETSQSRPSIRSSSSSPIETSQSRLSICSTSSSPSSIVASPESPSADEASEDGSPTRNLRI